MKANKVLRRLQLLAGVLLCLYALALLSLPVFWSVLGERHWPLILLRYLPGGLSLLPIPFFLLFVRDRRTWIASLALMGFCAFTFMGLQLNLGGSEQGELSVLSYNIRAGLGGPEEIASFLKSGDFDLIGLQEMRAPMIDKDADPLPVLEEALPDYQVARGGKRGELAIFSRYPIQSIAERDLGGLSKALEARVDVEGQTVRVLCVHLMTGDPLRKLKDREGRFQWLNVTAETRVTQFGALRELLDEDVPTILVGDFNTPPNSDGHDLLAEKLQDSFQEVGFGFGYTFRADIPVWRIDYIWASPSLVPQSVDVLSSQLSDHRPLLTRFSLEPRPDSE